GLLLFRLVPTDRRAGRLLEGPLDLDQGLALAEGPDLVRREPPTGGPARAGRGCAGARPSRAGGARPAGAGGAGQALGERPGGPAAGRRSAVPSAGRPARPAARRRPGRRERVPEWRRGPAPAA